MFSKLLQVFVFLLLTAATFSPANAQGFPSDQKKEELPKSIKENLAKQRIAREKKEYQELLKRSEEALKLTEDLEKSFAANTPLSNDDKKKLERLEKLVKKIRSDLGGDDNDKSEDEDKIPLSMANAFKVLQENTVKLVEELKKSTRYTISAVAIQSSNLLLKVVRFMRLVK